MEEPVTHLAVLLIGGLIGLHAQRRIDRHKVADLEHRAGLTDYFRDAADRLAVELDEASHAVTTLRRVVAAQAHAVRAALGRPQKRRIPGGAR
jgi:hypothetical protein